MERHHEAGFPPRARHGLRGLCAEFLAVATTAVSLFQPSELENFTEKRSTGSLETEMRTLKFIADASRKVSEMLLSCPCSSTLASVQSLAAFDTTIEEDDALLGSTRVLSVSTAAMFLVVQRLPR